MLFLLLSAQQDPLQQAVRILPMSETAREHTAASFSEALRGVFQSALKLAVFHAVFTWLTFRAFSIQLVYVSTVASAVCSILPLVQVWMVAIPAAAQLLVQVTHRCSSHSSFQQSLHTGMHVNAHRHTNQLAAVHGCQCHCAHGLAQLHTLLGYLCTARAWSAHGCSGLDRVLECCAFSDAPRVMLCIAAFDICQRTFLLPLKDFCLLPLSPDGTFMIVLSSEPLASPDRYNISSGTC